MAHEQLKPKDKVVMRMTGEGAVEENLTEGTSEKISKRPEDAQLVKPHDDAALVPPSEDEAKRRYQPQAQEQPQTEAPDVDELPVHDSPSHISPVSDVHHAAPVDVGRVISDTAVSSRLRRTDAVRNVDADAVLAGRQKQPPISLFPMTRPPRGKSSGLKGNQEGSRASGCGA